MAKFIQDCVTALNSVGSQPWAIVVLILGGILLIACKKMGIDTTIAGGVIGIAGNMLQNQIKQDIKAQHVDTVNQAQGNTSGSNLGK